MRLLDLFCGAGGAAMGYHRAGFDEIVGVDIKPQPRYPFEFIQADAMTFPLDGFDAIHASPPCQSYSARMKHLATPKPRLVDDVLARIEGRTYVVENVEGVVMPSAVILCGTSFGLRVHRHRWFQASFATLSPGCLKSASVMNPHNRAARASWMQESDEWIEKTWRREMGVEWMHKDEAREAIPPAFTQYLGAMMLKILQEQISTPSVPS